MMAMTRRDIRKRIRKLGGTPTSAVVERAEHSINTTPQEKKFREEQARERGILGVPIDPRSVDDPRKWYLGKRLDTRDPALERMKREREQRGGDRFK